MSSLEESEDSPVTIFADPRYDGGNDAGPRGMSTLLPRGGFSSRFQPSRPMGLGDEDAELARLPARVELVGRDKLVYHVPDAQPAAVSRARWATAGAAARSAQLSSSRRDSDPLGFEEEGSSYFEVIVPMTGASPAGDAAAAREQGMQLETLRDLADQVAQSMVRMRTGARGMFRSLGGLGQGQRKPGMCLHGQGFSGTARLG